MSYCRASRCFEYRISSPTQSLRRLMSSSSGRTASPPSQPHAAASDAVPPPATSRKNERRSITAGEPPAIPSGDHRPQRRGVDDEHEQDVHHQEADEDPHRPEVPVAGELEAAEQRREPGEL